LSILQIGSVVFSPLLQIWQDLFLDVSVAFVVIRGDAGGRGEMDALEQGCWSGGGGSIAVQ
jgi:hypothetical protein